MHQFGRALGDAGGAPALKMGYESDVFLHGVMGKEAGFLDHIAHRAPQSDGIPSRYGASEYQDFAAGGIQNTIDELQCRRFSGPPAPQEAQSLPFSDPAPL